MRRLVKLALIALGIRAFLRWRKSRQAKADAAAPASAADDPADELRRKLAETRDADPAPEATAEASVEERRAGVHEQGRAALDEMTPPDES